MLRSGQLNFSKGEIAEDLIARIDVPSYNAALKRARNVIVLKYGGVSKRPGTRFVAQTWGQGEPVRLFPFQFSITQAYVLEMGQGYMRAVAGGGMVIETQLKITAITKALNAKVTVAYHGYSVGDQLYFRGNNGMKEINNRFAKVLSVIDENNFTINIDTRSFGTFTASAGVVNSAPPPDPPADPPVSTPATPVTPPTVGTGGVGGDGIGDDTDTYYRELPNGEGSTSYP